MFLKGKGSSVVMLFVLTVLILAVAVTAKADFIPYGGINVHEDAEVAEMRFPTMVRDWFKDLPAFQDVIYSNPTFDGAHGSIQYGEAGWHTTHDEFLEFLSNLPDDRMTMEIISEVATRDEEGNIVKTFKLPLLVFSEPAVFHPEDLKDLGKPIVYFQGQIHGNEHAAGESKLALAELLAHGELDHILEEVSVVMIPRYNVDGAWLYQRGTNTAMPVLNNLDMNRDNTAFETPLTRIIHSVVNRYQPDVVLDTHEMGINMGWTRAEDRSTYMKDFFPYSLITLVAHPLNVPKGVQDFSRYVIEQNIWSDFEDAGLKAFYYFYNMRTEWIPATVFDGEELFEGEKSVRREIKEGNPDEGITDPAMSLKPSMSLLFETPRTGIKVLEKERVHSHVLGMKSILNTAAEQADEMLTIMAEAREEMTTLGETVCEEDEVVLWTAHGIFNEELEVLTFNEDYSDLEIDTWNVISHRTYDMHPLNTVVRPRAYIISGDAEEMDAVVERLSHTGAQIERLSEDMAIEVEAYTIEETVNPRDLAFSRGTAFGGLSEIVSFVDTDVVTREFPRDTYVVHTDQPAGTHVALSLEPLGNRSYVNYWLSRSGEGQEGFIPGRIGEEYQVYRYMGEERLNTYDVTLQLPFVENTMVRSLIPMTKEEMKQVSEQLGGEVSYMNHFQVIEHTKAFRILLPKSYNGVCLSDSTWYLYDWEKEEFAEIPSFLKPDPYLLVSENFICEDGSVLLVSQ